MSCQCSLAVMSRVWFGQCKTAANARYLSLLMPLANHGSRARQKNISAAKFLPVVSWMPGGASKMGK